MTKKKKRLPTAYEWLMHRLRMLDTEPEALLEKSIEEIDEDLRQAGIDPDPIVAKLQKDIAEMLKSGRKN